MPRKKQPKYGDMSKMLAELQERMAGERARMAGVMCESLLTGEAAAMLGDYSDADLRRIMGYVAKDIGKYVERLETEKAERKKARGDEALQVPSGTEYGMEDA